MPGGSRDLVANRSHSTTALLRRGPSRDGDKHGAPLWSALTGGIVSSMPLWITRCVCECVFSISISCTSAWSRSRFLPLKGNFSHFVTSFVTDWRGLALLTAASSCLKRSRERNQEILNLVYRINFLPLAHTVSLAA